jgi:A/G-specific adenine glycosylase
VPPLAPTLDALEAFHGEQTPGAPTDPYRFLVWWHCGYPPSEERCCRGFESLEREVGVTPEQLLSANSARLARVLKAGGLVPELRASRLKVIATSVRDDYAGDLRGALRRLAPAESHAALRRFPGIGAPGADRILLFGRIAPVAAIPSASPHVLVRIASGREPDRYTATYRQAQSILATHARSDFATLTRAYLLLQRHGRSLCKRGNPQCAACPVADTCAYFAATAARPPPARRRRSRSRRAPG